MVLEACPSITYPFLSSAHIGYAMQAYWKTTFSVTVTDLRNLFIAVLEMMLLISVCIFKPVFKSEAAIIAPHDRCIVSI